MRNTILTGCILIGLVTCLPGCSAHREQRHSFRIEEIDGVPTAINTGGPKYEGELFRFEKAVELKQDEDQPESLLQSSISFTMGADGWFYVEDNYACRIAVFDPEGRYTRSIGREGNGPGEFSKYYWELRGLHGDVLDVYDSMLRRATRYRTDGTLIEVVTFPQEIIEAAELQSLEGLIRSKQYLISDGQWVIIGNIFEEHQDIRSTGIRFISITADLERLDSAETPCIPNNYRIMMPTRSGSTALAWQGMPFAPDPEAVFVPGKGVLMTTGADPILEWYRLDGSIALKINLDLVPAPITEEEKSAYLRLREQQIEEQSREELKRILQSQLEGLRFPETRACWTSISVDDSGYIWLGVSESLEVREQLGGYAWYLVSPDGEFLGMTRSPYPGEVVRGRYLAVVTDPDTDERIPTVWRLVPAAEGFVYP